MAISDINIDSPQDGEEVADGARQIRTLKRDITTSFPNFQPGSSTVDKSAAQINDTPMKSATELITGQWSFVLPPYRGTSPFITAADVTYGLLTTNGLVGTGSQQVAQGSHGHASTGITDFTGAVQGIVAQWSSVSMHVGTGTTSFAVGNHTHNHTAISDWDAAIAATVIADRRIIGMNKVIDQTITGPTSTSIEQITDYRLSVGGGDFVWQTGAGYTHNALLGTILMPPATGRYRISYNAEVRRTNAGTASIIIQPAYSSLSSSLSAPLDQPMDWIRTFCNPIGTSQRETVSHTSIQQLNANRAYGLNTYADAVGNDYVIHSASLTIEFIY